MKQVVPLPDETRQSTETALDKSKPQVLPQSGLKPGQHKAESAQSARKEHPLSVGKP